jgi:hypothetical protein
MISAVDLYHTLHRKPFQPFRVYVKDGRVFDIRHRDLNVVKTDAFIIGLPANDDPDPFAGELVEVPLGQIDRIEPLKESAVGEEGLPARAEELYRTLHRQPFQPFRVILKDGRTYDVLHERLAVVGTTYFSIGTPVSLAPDDPWPLCETIDIVDLVDIERVEPLSRPA